MDRTPDGGWVLNPGASFILTIYRASQPQVEQIHRTLESVKDSGDDRPLRDLIPMFFRDKCYCREIENYIEVSAPVYIQRFEEAQNNCTEWSTAKKRRQNALWKEFRAQAIGALDMHPGSACRVDYLLSAEIEDDRAEAVVQLLSHTYTMAAYMAQRIVQATHPCVLPVLTGWEVSAVGDNCTCRFCEKAPKLFSKEDPPKIPRHLGCRCSLTAVLRHHS
jgi:hypothetical protein